MRTRSASRQRAPVGSSGAATRAGRVKRPRGRDPAGARNAMIQSAETIFRREGYFATDSNAIARAAGYAPGSFYTHFRDKLEVFLLVYERWVLGEWQAIDAAIGASAKTQDWIGRVVTSTLDHHRQWRKFRASLRALAAIEPSVRGAQNEQRRQQIKRLQDLCAARKLRRPDAATSLTVLLAAERILDAIAEGDMLVLGVETERACDALAAMLTALLGPTRA